MATPASPPSSDKAVCDECSQPAEDHFLVAVLGVGAKVKYTIPSFPVFSALLREAKIQFIDETECYDGYVRDCPSLNRPYPSLLKLCFGFTNAFSIDPIEFELSIPLDNKTLYEERVFIMWKWNWENDLNISDISENTEAGCDIVDDIVDDVDEFAANPWPESDDNVGCTHSLIFKCMGASKTLCSQEVLAESAQKLKRGESVEVRLRLEPTNPKDARAITFDCKHMNDWKLIGYVVHEALDGVHHAVENNLIVSVQFDWIRYITHWSRSGPGWYSGIRITKRGEWSNEVVRCRSTF